MINNQILNEDNLLTMGRIENESICGIITSPPYNITTKRKDLYYKNGYEDIDNLSEEEYIDLRITEFKEFSRIIKKDGVICYNISYHNENPILPIKLINEVHNQTDLTIADVISWKKSNAIPFQTSPTKLSRICELVYIIVKKTNIHNFKTNKQISKINEKTNQKFYKNYTNFIEAKNNDGIKSELKASYSEEFVEKLIDIYFPSNSLIYDPFSGIGTTARACRKKGLNFIGSELNTNFYNQSLELINFVNPLN
jgi:DNA modification methylase